MKQPRRSTPSSGNVFKDLELPRPEEAQVKAELAAKVSAILGKRQLTQRAAATLLGIDQPKVSALLRGRLSGFSTERMMRFLVALGSDVEIVVKEHSTPRQVGHLTVVAI